MNLGCLVHVYKALSIFASIVFILLHVIAIFTISIIIVIVFNSLNIRNDRVSTHNSLDHCFLSVIMGLLNYSPLVVPFRVNGSTAIVIIIFPIETMQLCNLRLL